MNKKSLFLKLLVATALFVTSTNYSQLFTPQEYLQQQTKPVFRPNHTLPPLQCNGYGSNGTYGNPGEPVRSYNNQLEMANWGYAFDFDGNILNPENFENNKAIIDNPLSDARKMIDLAKTNPNKYKLSGVIPAYGENGRVPFTPAECPDCFVHNAQGMVILDGGNKPVMNPLMSDESLLRIGKKLVIMYDYIKNITPFTNAVDYGETGPYLPLQGREYWLKDPKVVAESGFQPGAVNDYAWNIYYSKKWTKLMKGFWQKFPSVLTTDGFVNVYLNDGGESRGRFYSWNDYNTLFEYTKDLSKYANGQSYFNLQNTGYNPTPNGEYRPDILSTFLYKKSTELLVGQPYGVEWTNGACSTAETEYDRWTGFLKCLYVGGNLSGISGFFGDDWNAPGTPNYKTLGMLYPTSFERNNTPFYINQIMALSRVHAIFSWIEPFTRNSDLLVGNVRAIWGGNKNLLAEFSNTANDKGARVMVRKLKNENKYLLTAWAMTGEDRIVEIEIPSLGKIKVNARKAGTIYHVDNTSGTPIFTVLDNDSMGIVTDQNTIKNTLSYLYVNDNAEIISVIVPTSMQSGNKYTVFVTVKNTGIATWKNNGDWRLGSQNSQDNLTWGLGRVQTNTTVYPGQTHQYQFEIIAPSNIGNYNFQWQMVHDGIVWFGGKSNNAIVNVVAEQPDDNAEIISVDLPTSMQVGKKYTVSVIVKNTGNATWNNNSDWRLGSQNSHDNFTWGLARVQTNTTVYPGQTHQYQFEIIAPSNIGSYNFQWRMVHDGVVWFGNHSENVVVNVYLQRNDNAEIISVDVPTSMQAGNKYTVSVNVKNTGNASWYKNESWKLGSQNTQDNLTWGTNRVETNTIVNPGQTHQYQFEIIAPSSLGNYNFQWKMVNDAVDWFGGKSNNVLVEITNSISSKMNTKDISSVALSSDVLTIFPNPNNGSFNLNFDNLEGGNYILEINNLSGRNVYKENLNNFHGNISKRLDLSLKEKEVYIITLTNSNNSKILKKLIIN